jgi:hypothetical protein
MALRKNKIDILYKLFSQEEDEWIGYWEEDDYPYSYHETYCDCEMCLGVGYEYIDGSVDYPLNPFINILRKHGNVWREGNAMSTGRMIDMDSISYSKEVMREKKINQILGISTYKPKIPTFGDIINK